MISRNKWRRT